MTEQNKSVQAETFRQWLAQANPALLMKLFLSIMAALGILFFLAWLRFGDGLALFANLPLEPSMPVSAADEFGLVAQPGLVNMQVDGVDLGTVHRLDLPTSLEVNGFRLTVAPEQLNQESVWTPVALGANQVGWLENSLINYTFRLPANRGYRDILETAAQEKGLMTLVTAQGNRFDFSIENGTAQAALPNPQLLQQKRPSITLLWLDNYGSNAGYVLTGSYIPSIHLLEAPGIGGLAAAAANDAQLPAVNLSVRVDGIDIQTDGLQMLVRGSVTNSGIEEGVLEAKDIVLVSGELRSQIISIDPPLPWRIPPNNSQMIFTAVFQRPLHSEGSLTIGSQEFVLQFTQPTE